MKKSNQIYLQDISMSIAKIQKYLVGFDYVKFTKHDLVQDGVLRNLEVIGEAATKLDKKFVQENPDFPIKKAVAMRNFLIHDYDMIDFQIVWLTIKKDLPIMKKQIKDKKLIE